MPKDARSSSSSKKSISTASGTSTSTSAVSLGGSESISYRETTVDRTFSSQESESNKRILRAEPNPEFRWNAKTTKFPVQGAGDIVAYLQQTCPSTEQPPPKGFLDAINQLIRRDELHLNVLRKRNKAMYDSGDTGGCELDPSVCEAIPDNDVSDRDDVSGDELGLESSGLFQNSPITGKAINKYPPRQASATRAVPSSDSLNDAKKKRPKYYVSEDYPFPYTARVSVPPSTEDSPLSAVLDIYVVLVIATLYWCFWFPYLMPFILYLTFVSDIIPGWSFAIMLVAYAIIAFKDKIESVACDELANTLEKARGKFEPGVWTYEGEMKEWKHPKLYSIPWWLKPQKWLGGHMGDSTCTAAFTINSHDGNVWQSRIWVTVTENQYGTQPEAVSIDFVFPIVEEEVEVTEEKGEGRNDDPGECKTQMRGTQKTKKSGQRTKKPQPLNKDTKFLLVVPGLNGGSREAYILNLAAAAIRQNYVVASVTSRGFGGTPISGLELWHQCRIADLKAASYACEEIWKIMVNSMHYGSPNSRPDSIRTSANDRFFACGWSAGGITLGKLFADPDFSKDNPFRGGASIAGGANTSCNASYHRSHWLWQPPCLNYFKKSYECHGDKVRARNEQIAKQNDAKRKQLTQEQATNPNGDTALALQELDQFCLIDLKNRPWVELGSSLKEFDMHFGAPYHGYGSAGDMQTLLNYYRDHPSTVENIQTPFLFLMALDDCLVPVESMAPVLICEKPHQCITMLTESGGHMAWPMGTWGSRHYDEELQKLERAYASSPSWWVTRWFVPKILREKIVEPFKHWLSHYLAVLRLSILEQPRGWRYVEETLISGSPDGGMAFFEYLYRKPRSS